MCAECPLASWLHPAIQATDDAFRNTSKKRALHIRGIGNGVLRERTVKNERALDPCEGAPWRREMPRLSVLERMHRG